MSLSIAATSATLICTIVFGIVFLSSLLGRSWRLLSPLDRLLGSLGFLFGPPGALLAASWSLLGRSWGGLGASWAPLGPSWRRSKTTQKQHAKKERFRTSHGTKPPSFLAPQRGPKIDQIRTQDESKFKKIFKIEKVELQEPLGAVLG